MEQSSSANLKCLRDEAGDFPWSAVVDVVFQFSHVSTSIGAEYSPVWVRIYNMMNFTLKEFEEKLEENCLYLNYLTYLAINKI